MRVKREHNGRPTHIPGALKQTLDNLQMSAMHAVEVTNGNCPS
jgi:hypothetical protein